MFTTLQITSRDQGILFVETFEQRHYGNAPQTDAEAEALANARIPRRAPFWSALTSFLAIRQIAH